MLLDSIEGEAEGDVSLVLVPETVDLVYAWASSIISSTSFLYCNKEKGILQGDKFELLPKAFDLELVSQELDTPLTSLIAPDLIFDCITHHFLKCAPAIRCESALSYTIT